ncbi:hypothetical protein [Pseudomonas cerasi]
MYAPLTITDLGSPMEHKTSPDHLSPDEFASMMEEFDKAGAWMQEQLKRIAQAQVDLRPKLGIGSSPTLLPPPSSDEQT